MGQAEGNETVALAEEQQILFVPVPFAFQNWLRPAIICIVLIVIAIPIVLLLKMSLYAKIAIVSVGFIYLLGLSYIVYRLYRALQWDHARVDSINYGSVCNTSEESIELSQIFARTIGAIKGGLAKKQLPGVKAIVDPLLEDEIQSIKLHNELLEQEFLQSSVPIKEKYTLFMLATMSICFIYGIINQDWIFALCGFCFLTFNTLPRISFVRERLPFLRNDEYSMLVGPGWLTFDNKKTKWTVADSIMLLRLKTPKPLGTLHVRLLGPTKDFNFTFQSVRDPEFIRLWQRWMHPNPRLELMDQDT